MIIPPNYAVIGLTMRIKLQSNLTLRITCHGKFCLSEQFYLFANIDFRTVVLMRKPYTVHIHNDNWYTFCTFGARFFLVFGTSSPAILKNCIIFDGWKLSRSRALRRFDENEASSKLMDFVTPPCSNEWFDWTVEKIMQILTLKVT